MDYIPESCPHCQQTTTYLLPIDRGTADLVKKIALFIQRKGINAVHPRKEMEGSYLTSNDVGNLSRPRFHGLIAHIDGEKGNYCLTTKGLEFLDGKPIPKYAIISKVEKRQIGYWSDEVVSIKELYQGEKWEAINFIIENGRVLTKNTLF